MQKGKKIGARAQVKNNHPKKNLKKVKIHSKQYLVDTQVFFLPFLFEKKLKSPKNKEDICSALQIKEALKISKSKIFTRQTKIGSIRPLWHSMK